MRWRTKLRDDVLCQMLSIFMSAVITQLSDKSLKYFGLHSRCSCAGILRGLPEFSRAKCKPVSQNETLHELLLLNSLTLRWKSVCFSLSFQKTKSLGTWRHGASIWFGLKSTFGEQAFMTHNHIIWFTPKWSEVTHQTQGTCKELCFFSPYFCKMSFFDLCSSSWSHMSSVADYVDGALWDWMFSEMICCGAPHIVISWSWDHLRHLLTLFPLFSVNTTAVQGAICLVNCLLYIVEMFRLQFSVLQTHVNGCVFVAFEA